MNAPRIPDPFAGMAISTTQAAAARRQLELLAEQGRDPRIKKMARDVLSGRTDLRAAMLGGKYDDALNEATASFSSWYRDLSDGDRAEQVRMAAEAMDQVRREAAEERLRPRRSRRTAPEDDDWEPPAGVLRREPPRR